MMKVLIDRASNTNWYSIKNFDTFQDVINYMEKKNQPLILSHNFMYGLSIKNIMSYWDDIEMPEEDAIAIQNSKYKIKIYDDYIE